MKKKKSRGNRKLQRFRAKLKKQGLDHETIATMINNFNNPSRSTDERNFKAFRLWIEINDTCFINHNDDFWSYSKLRNNTFLDIFLRNKKMNH